MDPLTIGLVTGGASLLGSMFSSSTSASNTQAQIAASQQQQATQNQFQEQMSNTAYQRASKDMTAAGLNPAMMFGSGSAASSPSGSSIQAPMPQNKSGLSDLGANVSKGIDAMVSAKTVDKMGEEMANYRVARDKMAADIDLSRAHASESTERTKNYELDAQSKTLGLPNREFESKSAKDLLSIPDAARRTGNVASWAVGKADDAIAPFISSARAIKSLRPSRTTSETTTNKFDGGSSTFNERWEH